MRWWSFGLRVPGPCCRDHGCLFSPVNGHRVDVVVWTVLQNLLELVANEMANDNCQKDASLMAFYNATLSHIASQKALPDKASLYEEIQI